MWPVGVWIMKVRGMRVVTVWSVWMMWMVIVTFETTVLCWALIGPCIDTSTLYPWCIARFGAGLFRLIEPTVVLRHNLLT